MSGKKTQAELESYVKGYQLVSLQERFDSFEKQITLNLTTINASLQTLITQSNSYVTPQQQNDNIKASEDKIRRDFNDLAKQVDGNNKTFRRFAGAALGGAIMVLASAILIVINGGNG